MTLRAVYKRDTIISVSHTHPEGKDWSEVDPHIGSGWYQSERIRSSIATHLT